MPTFGANDRFRAEIIVDDRPVEEFGLDGDTWVSSSKERGIFAQRPPCIRFELRHLESEGNGKRSDSAGRPPPPRGRASLRDAACALNLGC
jgi:hypothetical protein